MSSVQASKTTSTPWAETVAALPTGKGRRDALKQALEPLGLTPQAFRAHAVGLEASVSGSPWPEVAKVMDDNDVPLHGRDKDGDRGNTTTGHLCRRNTRKHVGVARLCGYSGQVALR